MNNAPDALLRFPDSFFTLMLVTCIGTALLGASFGFKHKQRARLWIALFMCALLSTMLLRWFNERYIHEFDDGPTLAEPAFGCQKIQAYKQRFVGNDEEDWEAQDWRRILELPECQGGAAVTLALNTLIRCLTTFLSGLLIGGLARRITNPESVAHLDEKSSEPTPSPQSMPSEQLQSYEKFAEPVEATKISLATPPEIGLTERIFDANVKINDENIESKTQGENCEITSCDSLNSNADEEGIDSDLERILDRISENFGDNRNSSPKYLQNSELLSLMIHRFAGDDEKFKKLFKDYNGPIGIKLKTFEKIASQGLSAKYVKQLFIQTSKFARIGLDKFVYDFICIYEAKVDRDPTFEDSDFFTGVRHLVEELKNGFEVGHK